MTTTLMLIIFTSPFIVGLIRLVGNDGESYRPVPSARGQLESDWTRATLPDPRDLMR